MTTSLEHPAPPGRGPDPRRWNALDPASDRTGSGSTRPAGTTILEPITTVAHRLLYLASAVPLGAAWLVLLITGWVVVAVLAITPLLPGALIAFGTAIRFAAWVEGHLARRLLGARARPRRLRTAAHGYWGSVGGVLGDPRFWTSQVFLALRCVLGLVSAIVVFTVIAAGLEGVLAPVIHRILPTEDGHGIDVGIWLVDTMPEAVLLVPVGLVVLAAGIGLALAFGALWRALATALLGGDPRARRLQTDGAPRLIAHGGGPPTTDHSGGQDD